MTMNNIGSMEVFTFPSKYTPPPTVRADIIVPNIAKTQIEPMFAKKLP